ncbi:MAG: glutamine synthetase type III [Elusimicrobiaceae bacterium]|jgi:glutamine synthetase|nr:glutamine synthetase type III [Elusimicrobiaceae bacterium]MBT3954799.1 glutamine synthetase type III [Elusimicrobiaceae bacterium]MBT4008793.1 glutamine synthetase type III [Elusimicrobiaceae bacterium]MBT5987306.1 glutamine synthetase type III [Elusimicrobiaceae bacterium]MBT6715969.1 glutamine synthetase type III [Elusimicrobiaceae bacterium]
MKIKYQSSKEIFGKYLFDRKAMRRFLPHEIYKKYINAMENGSKLDESIADFMANAMKEWAISKGATHYTHWFMPRTENIAEKHMAFLSTDKDGSSIESFKGSELIKGEPDASSFPSGGIRSTFEARGYSAWDPTSPAFIIKSKKGGTLCIPSVFISLNGASLDMKTPLIKSINSMQTCAMKLLKKFGNRTVKSVDVTIGAEQEYFLIDEEKAKKRPDITLCGRTLIGEASPREQTVEAHYFGSIAPRSLSFMEDVERDMYKIGQVLLTRHNEVAPCQFEFAPDVSEANLGCDMNHALMEAMRKVSIKHKMKLLLHEKPFAGINGSGKHLNFSLKDSDGKNLLTPSSHRTRNIQFLTFLSAFLLGAAKHDTLLRACIASPGNMHRLGGFEAPPAIMSIYLGDLLTNILDTIGKNPVTKINKRSFIDLGLHQIPDVKREDSDRNRTSPIAFTGNKFEFRAVGSSQAIAGPLSNIIAVWTAGIDEITEIIETKMDATGGDIERSALEAISHAAKVSEKIRFEGNSYSDEWPKEAKKRGLPIATTTFDALQLLLKPENKKLLARLNIMNENELEAFHEIRMEQYVSSIDVELATLKRMIWEGVMPAISKQLILETDSIKGVGESFSNHWKTHITNLAGIKDGLFKELENLEEVKARYRALGLVKKAEVITKEVLPLMDRIRTLADSSERVIAEEIWPYPKYKDLLVLD